MKIALIGYGKMGKSIEALALERGHEIVLKISSQNKDELNPAALKVADLAIEFTQPETALSNIELCLKNKIPVVIGTTGWYEHYETMKNLCKEKEGSMLAATNFSVGVNLFFELNRKLAALMSAQRDYSARIEEIHHTEKLDSPSGTAITIAEGLINTHPSYSKWENLESKEASVLPILSKREAGVPGTHIVTYESDIDYINIEHVAKSRKGFALGAVLAAEFIANKKGIFNMSDVLNF